MDSLLDHVAILAQFADEGIDLLQAQRGLLAALQIAANELVIAHAQLQRRSAGLIASSIAVLFGKREHALDAADSEFALASMDGIGDRADTVSGLVRTRQQLQQLRRRTTRAILIADAVPATFAAQMLAQQLAGVRIQQPHIHRVPLHVDLASDPARWSAVVSRFNLDAAI